MKNYSNNITGIMNCVKDCVQQAYNKGYKEGIAEAKDRENVANDNGYKKGYDDGIHCGYRAALTLIHVEYEEAHDVFDATKILERYTPEKAIEKLNNYSKPVDEIKVGDEVCLKSRVSKLDNCDIGICTYINHEDCTIYVMRMDGSCDEQPMNEWRKTGRHFDIDKILEQMKEVDK